MKNTGQLLKEAREKKGISIAEVSLATKINSRILTAIEQGNLSKLPPKTFLRGFVLSYASFLGLDADEVMRMFQEEMGTTRPKPEITDSTLTSAPTSERSAEALSSSSNNNFAKIAAVVGIILLVVIIVVLKKKMESYQSESVPAPTEISTPTTPDPNSAPAETTSSTPPAEMPAVVVASPTPSATPTPTTTPTPAPKPSPTPTPTPTPTSTATPKPSPSPTASPTASPSPSPTPALTGKVQDVTIEALDDVDIEATIDGEARTIRLKAEQVHTIKARRKVSLRLSDGGAVSIIVNGVDRGVPGDLGKPMKVDLP